ncbi:hypothetical protein RclHR1_11760002 [Rhizophagus clarus]|uniref:Uncharacterized protein n=1 Tax=Rhizophagus clarus TaxID=94130 RepID=A0A2Z6QWX7_9GLOM|nr:hypothetical protein RclHR1_11760002 [Rhizophagus clarus]
MCDQLFVLLEHLTVILPENFQIIIEELRNKLYFLAHQARKVHLNNQFKAKLLEFDDDGAILVCDYKMRILPKSACEIKKQFFGKLQAFNHWSTDTKQDAWFTASSFDAIFETLNPKPKWIKIFSDNGNHYHNSELMTIEAKSSVDSHHVQIVHSIKRYPIEGPFIRYIQAQTLPHIGEWSRYSPTDISKLIDESLHKPTPDISTHIKPNLP